MNDDFAKLAAHPIFKDILIKYLEYRVKRATKPQLVDLVKRAEKKEITSAIALDELADISANGSDRGFIVKKGKPSESEDKKPESTPAADKSSFEENRCKARTRDVDGFKDALAEVKIANYLDIGCGNGSITSAIGEYLQLPKTSIFGADIPTWAGHSHEKEVVEGITFKAIDISVEKVTARYKIDLPSANFEFITLFMVLHHVRDHLLPAVMDEISRLLAPGGLVLIREHDSPNHMIDSLINIEHGVFEVALECLSSGETFGKEYYGQYKTSREWRQLFALYGFEHLQSTPPNGATRAYYSLFKKTASGSPPIDKEQTPELMAEARKIGIPGARAAQNNEDLKSMITHGKRHAANQ